MFYPSRFGEGLANSDIARTAAVAANGVKFADGNSLSWNEYWNKGYADAEDPLGKGVLISKPHGWHPMLWEAYQDGAYHADQEASR